MRNRGNTPEVSVIVPFYNIEECVSYCVDSLLNQKFGDYELLLIDDGSTDSTGTKLEELSLKDERISVYHKPNGGLSDARNYGLKKAKGKYVTFVDGDDLVSPWYLEHLVFSAKKYPNSIIFSGFKNINYVRLMETPHEWQLCNAEPEEVMDQGEMIVNFLYDYIAESAWGKLVPRCAYDDGFFPVGSLYEDLATFPKLISRFSSFVRLDVKDYGYVCRPNSIVRSRSTKIQQVYDYVDALQGVMDWIEDNVGMGVEDRAVRYRTCLAFMRMHPVLQKVDDGKEEARKIMKEQKSFVRRSLKVLCRDPHLSYLVKFRIFLFSLSPSASERLNSAYQHLKLYNG